MTKTNEEGNQDPIEKVLIYKWPIRYIFTSQWPLWPKVTLVMSIHFLYVKIDVYQKSTDGNPLSINIYK